MSDVLTPEEDGAADGCMEAEGVFSSGIDDASDDVDVERDLLSRFFSGGALARDCASVHRDHPFSPMPSIKNNQPRMMFFIPTLGFRWKRQEL